VLAQRQAEDVLEVEVRLRPKDAVRFSRDESGLDRLRSA